jgi:hypothetical protein
MATMMNRLTAVKVQALKTAGLHPDGAGLNLKISPSGSKSWVLRYMLSGRPRYLGLGPTTSVSLARARSLAAEARDLIRQNIDPIDQREQESETAMGATKAEGSIAEPLTANPRDFENSDGTTLQLHDAQSRGIPQH